MTGTTHAEFGEKTQAIEVARAFSRQIVGKTILITGVNLKGIGFTTAQALASQSPATLIFAGRTPSRVKESISALKAEYPDVTYRVLELNLSSQKDVRKAAAELLSWEEVPAIDIIINNAAVMNIPERTLSEDGIEIQFATNHVGHFLFTCLIMPKLIKAATSNEKGATRIINVSSLSVIHGGIRWSDPNFETINKDLPKDEQPSYDTIKAFAQHDPESRAYVPLEGYNQSKRGNLLFSIGANAHLYAKYGILSFTLHPGIIDTELSRYAGDEVQAAIEKMKEVGMIPYVKTMEGGAATSLVASLDPKLKLPSTREDGKENYGVFLRDCQVSDQVDPRVASSNNAERLWKVTEGLVKQQFSW